MVRQQKPKTQPSNARFANAKMKYQLNQYNPYTQEQAHKNKITRIFVENKIIQKNEKSVTPWN